MLPSADYIVPVEIEGQTHNVYVIKRPGVDHFLTEMGKIYEVVVFTASLSKVSRAGSLVAMAIQSNAGSASGIFTSCATQDSERS